MAVYEITSPQGQTYEITAPDDATQEQVLAYARNSIAVEPMQDTVQMKPETGTNAGPVNAATYGFNSAIPFGNAITDAIGAMGAKAYDYLSGENLLEGRTLRSLRDESYANTRATEDANPLANIAGMAAGIASTLPIGVSKAVTGSVPSGGIRGAVNAIPRATSALANLVRRGEIAGTGAGSRAANIALRSLKGGAVAAPVGYAYGAGEAVEGERLQGGQAGARTAASVGAGLPVAGAALSGMASAVAPKLAPATAALASKARDFGIPLSIDQASPTRFRNTLQKVSQEIPFSGVDAFQAEQRAAWNSALAKTIGQDADNLSPETVKKFLSDANKKFSSAIGDTNVTFGQKDLNRIGDIVDTARGEITGDKVAIVEKNVEKFIKDSGFEFGKGRTINSKKLASLRSSIINKLPKIDSGARQHVAEIVDVIDDVAERYMTPEQVSTLRQARREWRNYKTIDPLLEKSTDGTINPTELMSRIQSSKYIDASKTGVGDDNLVDLARIGKQFMPKKGGSDTMQKSALLLGAGGAGTGLLTAPEATLSALALAGGGMIGNRAFQRLNQSQRLLKAAIDRTENPKALKLIGKYTPAKQSALGTYAATTGELNGTN